MNGSWLGTANEVGARTVDAVWRASWQGAIAIAGVWLLCRAWKRIPSSVRCALWLLVCLKLIVALTPAGITIPCLPSTTPALARVTVSDYPAATSGLTKHPLVSEAPLIYRPLPRAPSQAAAFLPPREFLSAAAWLAGLWILGIVLVGAYTIGQLAKSLRLIRKSSPCTDQRLLVQAEELRQLLELRVKPRLMITDDSTSVLTFAAGRPIILLSSKTVADCTSGELRMVLAHEFAHVRRRDAWLGLIPQLAQTLFYFHPMVWLACREFDFAREAACDEEAISCLQIGSDLYGRLLLKLGSRRRTAATLCTPGVSSHFHLLRRRIAMLDKSPETTLRSTHRRSLALTCLIGALCIAPFSLVQGQFATTASLRTTSSVTAKTASLKTASTTIAKITSKKAAKTVALRAKTSAKKFPIVSAKKIQPTLKVSPNVPVLKGPSTEQFPLEARVTPSLHVFRLKHASADQAAEALRRVMGPGSEDRVVAELSSNSIVVNAPEAWIAQIAGVIKGLDEFDRVESKGANFPKEPQQVSVYKLKYAQAEKLYDVLHTLYGNQAFAVVKVESDVRTNSIIVISPENRVPEVTELINKLDVPTPEAPPGQRVVIRRIKVVDGDAKQIVKRVLEILGKDAPEYIAAEPQWNEILVRTTEDNCNKVQTLVNILDLPKK